MKVRVCPKCNKRNLENAFNCIDCGTTLSLNTLLDVESAHTNETSSGNQATPAIAPVYFEQDATKISSTDKTGNIFCISCGAELPGESKFCWKCGTQVQKFTSVSRNTIVEQTDPSSIQVVGQREFRPISCAIGNCNNSVIEQCGSCGRYYCANHNIGNLCSICGRQKAEQDLYLNYLQTAEKVKRETAKRAITKATQINLTKDGFLEFYKAWDVEKPFQEELKETFASGGRFALSLTGPMASSIAHDTMEENKRAQLRSVVSDAVDDGLKRHGL